MPKKSTIQKARRDRARGRAPFTQAGEFVREEMEQIRQGKTGARNAKQAIAIGLSKARRAGVKLPPAPAGTPSAEKERRTGKRRMSPAGRRSLSRARKRVMLREGRGGASRQALSRHSQDVARKRGPAARRRSAEKAVRTKGPDLRRQAARKAARTRARRRAA